MDKTSKIQGKISLNAAPVDDYKIEY